MRGIPYAFPPFWVLLLVVPIWIAQDAAKKVKKRLSTLWGTP